MRNKILSLLVLLLTAATGAWAEETETLLTTITPTGKTTYSETTPGVVTVTHENDNFYGIYGWVWWVNPGSVTVVANEGYTITKCVFSHPNKTVTVSTAPFKINFIYNEEIASYYCEGTNPDGGMNGVSSIEVYGYASASDVEVTTNAASEGATFTEATFQMPAFDATADYELVRDMSYGIAFSGVPTRARLAKDGNGKFHFADGLTFQLLDNIDAANPKDITSAEGITFMIGEMEAFDIEGSTYYRLNKETLVPLADFLNDAKLGNYTICAVAASGEYDGTFSSGMIKLFQGYEVEVAAKEFVTYYKDEPLYADTETSADAQLYTIQSVSGDQAQLSAAIETAPSYTPLLIFNNSDEDKTFLLIPANEEPSPISYYGGFIGTTDNATILASTEGTTNYALNGKAFVFVKSDLAIGANKAWLSISNSNARQINLVFDSEATGISTTNLTNYTNGDWYDLNGRKLQGMPTKKGVYIMNGKKVVVK